MRHLGIITAAVLLIASTSFAQEPVLLQAWNGESTAWETGTETIVSQGKIVPMVGATSLDGTTMMHYFPVRDSASSQAFRPIPDGAPVPPLDVSLMSFVSADSVPWVETWPTDGSDPYLEGLQDVPPAKYIFDFGGMRDLDQRWQWMLSYPDGEGQTSFWNVSYASPVQVAQFPGEVAVEPRLHETRVAGQVNDFVLRFAWPQADMGGVVLLDGIAAQPDTVAWEGDTPVDLAWCPRMIGGSDGSLYAIVQESANTYSLVHQAGAYGTYVRSTFQSEQTPTMLTTPGYQKTDLLDADFVAWVARLNGHDVIMWVRIHYQYGYDSPTVVGNQYVAQSDVNRLRAQYMSAMDEYGPYDSWYIYWSEYNPLLETTVLQSLMADRDPWGPTSYREETTEQPHQFSLAEAYPNPFNASTVVPFELSRAGDVSIAVYDLLGQRVASLAQGAFAAGKHRVAWSPAPGLASGTYLVRLQSKDGVQAKRVVLMK